MVRLRKLRLFDGYRLAQLAGQAVVDQDLIAVGHHRVPIAALCERLGRRPAGQIDFRWKKRRLAGQTGDKQCDNDYHAAQHHDCQYRHQPSQKA